VSATGVDTDVAINGNGFFVVEENGVQSYTRAGNFEIGTNNLLETAGGQTVMGYPATNGVVNTSAGLSTLELGAGTSSPATATANLQMTTNLNATGGVGSTYSTTATIYDSLGAPHQLTVTYTNTGVNTWSYQLSIPSADLSPTVSGTPPVSTPQTGILQTGTLTFDGNGNLISDTQGTGAAATPPTDITASISGFADGASNQTFNWNVLNGTTPVITQLAAANSTASIEQDGTASAPCRVSVSVPMAPLPGRSAMERRRPWDRSRSPVSPTSKACRATGQHLFDDSRLGPAHDRGADQRRPGQHYRRSLEASNVDIATEFSNLIVAQRSYEANARVITTFDQIEQDTIALKQ